MNRNISDYILYVGVDDTDLDLFESQYPLPNGITYNSFIILDDKVAIIDTVDSRKADAWLETIKKTLGDRMPDYLVISHAEPDHTGGIKHLCEIYPQMKIVGNKKTFMFLAQFMDIKGFEERQHLVKDQDILHLGTHSLQFFMAPMVHWPEVMMSYEAHSKTLFSADGFGAFGTSKEFEEWPSEARRYYHNILGKYGGNVQAILKKIAGKRINVIAPLHGMILRDNIEYYIDKYDKWSRYIPETNNILICHASIHGNTAQVAKELKQILEDKGVKNVAIFDLTRGDVSWAVDLAFYSSTIVFAAASYDSGVFPPMENFLQRLKEKKFQNRRVALIENASWAPSAAKMMKSFFADMNQITLLEPVVSILSRYKESDKEALVELANVLSGKIK